MAMTNFMPAIQVLRERFEKQPDGSWSRIIEESKLHWLPIDAPSDRSVYTPNTTDEEPTRT